jgi:hypothetical protein
MAWLMELGSFDCAMQTSQLARKLAAFALRTSATVHFDRILALTRNRRPIELQHGRTHVRRNA